MWPRLESYQEKASCFWLMALKPDGAGLVKTRRAPGSSVLLAFVSYGIVLVKRLYNRIQQI
jgi:hypothetical protein